MKRFIFAAAVIVAALNSSVASASTVTGSYVAEVNQFNLGTLPAIVNVTPFKAGEQFTINFSYDTTATASAGVYPAISLDLHLDDGSTLSPSTPGISVANDTNGKDEFDISGKTSAQSGHWAVQSLLVSLKDSTETALLNGTLPSSYLSAALFDSATFQINLKYTGTLPGSGDTFSGQASAAGHVISPAVTPTPIPAALPLFISALGCLGFVGWRRKQAGAA